MMLGELIAYLEDCDPAIVCPVGFARPHSYRGYYEDLAFEPAPGVTAGSMLACAREAMGSTYEGWKGGEFMMGEYDTVWLAERGRTGEGIGPVLLDFMTGKVGGGHGVAAAGEIERLRRLESVVKGVLAQEADDVCWRDIYEEMSSLVGVEFRPTLLPRDQFLRNCAHFADCLASGEHYETPDPSSILPTLRAASCTLEAAIDGDPEPMARVAMARDAIDAAIGDMGASRSGRRG